ncbi:hypothetical protein CDAR_576641 [Caerostris darwini]|uniref:Uncharacterized protein n=1 Tax=Caerostris darwini TaxID=1538125 RepID=A0AAV4TIY4_9ARAC|nr:hypothetical protein CDAR_576641 [Caerostris darwini]
MQPYLQPRFHTSTKRFTTAIQRILRKILNSPLYLLQDAGPQIAESSTRRENRALTVTVKDTHACPLKVTPRRWKAVAFAFVKSRRMDTTFRARNVKLEFFFWKTVNRWGENLPHPTPKSKRDVSRRN